MDLIRSRVITQITLAEDNLVYLRFRGSSRLVGAKALEVTQNALGEVTHLLLDRLIHLPLEDRFEYAVAKASTQHFVVSGCYVSELSLRGA